jgi:HK97 family phage prohead protease
MRRNSPLVGEERRGLALAEAEVDIRDGSDGAKRFYGYSAVFSTRTAIGNPRTWGFYEQILPGAFTKTLDEGDQRFLVNHDSTLVVSRRSAGTLTLSQDERGLLTDSALDPELSYVRDLKANLRNGNITGQSFGFTVPTDKDEWTMERMITEDGLTVEVEVRTIREARLLETSSCTFPAYDETTAGLRHSLVPALLHRGDAEAIRRAATYRPDLAALLGYEPELAPTTIDLGGMGDLARAIRGAEQVISTTSTNPPAGEPGEPTHRTDDSTAPAAPTGTEPVASTRNAPTQHELAKARLQELHARMRRSAA